MLRRELAGHEKVSTGSRCGLSISMPAWAGDAMMHFDMETARHVSNLTSQILDPGDHLPRTLFGRGEASLSPNCTSAARCDSKAKPELRN